MQKWLTLFLKPLTFRENVYFLSTLVSYSNRWKTVQFIRSKTITLFKIQPACFFCTFVASFAYAGRSEINVYNHNEI